MNQKLTKRYNENPNASDMLEEIRSLLGLTINQMCWEMDWPGSNYWNTIKNGVPRDGGTKKPPSPTFNKVFDGINYALKTYPHWSEKKIEITAIIVKHIIK